MCVFCLNDCQSFPLVLSVKPNPPSGSAQVTALLSWDTSPMSVCFSHRNHTACFYVFSLCLLHSSTLLLPLYSIFPCYFYCLSLSVSSSAIQIAFLLSPFPCLHLLWVFLLCQFLLVVLLLEALFSICTSPVSITLLLLCPCSFIVSLLHSLFFFLSPRVLLTRPWLPDSIC